MLILFGQKILFGYFFREMLCCDYNKIFDWTQKNNLSDTMYHRQLNKSYSQRCQIFRKTAALCNEI